MELGVFTALADDLRTEAVWPRSSACTPAAAETFATPLVALGMLDRDHDLYSNTPATDAFLERRKPSYIGGLLEMQNVRLYQHWGSLTNALRTAQPQNEIKGGKDLFTALYSDPVQLERFLAAMTGVSSGTGHALGEKFPWDRYYTVIDIGTAQGLLPVQLALTHPHLHGGGFDLPPVRPIFDACVTRFGIAHRLHFYPGDFFIDELAAADVLVMGHILHDWDLAQKRTLLAKAYKALPSGGALVVYEALIDDDRRTMPSVC